MKRLVTCLTILAAASDFVLAQSTWTLQQCLDYAQENNNTILIRKNNYLSGLEDTEQAKAALLPTLSASMSQGVTNHAFMDGSTRYNGSYGVNANMTLWNGGRLINAIRQQEVMSTMDSLDVESSIISIKSAIISTYIQCLYATESITVNESNLKVAQAQRDRAREMKAAGKLGKVEVAQLESQVSTFEYQLVAAQGNLDGMKLQLKQLLQLGIDEEMILSDVDATEDEILRLVPEKRDIYRLATETMPDIARSNLAIKSAELSLRQAKAGYMPTLGLSAGIGTNNMSGTGNNFTKQIQDNFNENIGLTLSIPIVSGRRNKTAVNKAGIALENSRISQANTANELQKQVENTYHDAMAARAQYLSARSQCGYAQESFDLTSEQFNVGMKNTVDLITAQNNLLSAQQAMLQAKYIALMNLDILDIYMGNK